MYSNRRPYYGLKLSIADFFREPVRYLKQSNTQESMMEKPYLIDEYPKMHLSIPDFKYKLKERPGFLGPIATGVPRGGLAMIDFGEAGCNWDINRAGGCIKEPIIITLVADYLFTVEFNFTAQIIEDTIGVTLAQLPGTKAGAWDKQDYQITFPENSTGSVTICGFASTNTLISQTFETVVAGMPVGIYLSGGAFMPIERGQAKPATLLKSSYGEKGANCGCIEFSSQCACECKSIGYTTQQMAINEVQGLSVIDPVAGCTYDWSITSGGGSLSSPTGTSVNYTAPSSNAECAQNPTIVLKTDGATCDLLNIAINGYAGDEIAFEQDGTGCYSAVPNGGTMCGGQVCDKPYCWQCCTDKLKCDGTFESQTWSVNCWDYHALGCYGSAWCSTICTSESVTDVRTEAMISDGCCPSGLL